jgi:hypothetical protein
VRATRPHQEVDVNAVLLAAQEAELGNPLPIPPAGFGLLAFGGLLALLAFTWAFRHAGNKH